MHVYDDAAADDDDDDDDEHHSFALRRYRRYGDVVTKTRVFCEHIVLQTHTLTDRRRSTISSITPISTVFFLFLPTSHLYSSIPSWAQIHCRPNHPLLSHHLNRTC